MGALRTVSPKPSKMESLVKQPVFAGISRLARHANPGSPLLIDSSPLLAFLLGVLLLGMSFGPGVRDLAGQQPDPIKPADTSSPRATLNSFIDSCNELHRRITADRYFDRTSSAHHPLVTRILDCLDTSELSEFERVEAAAEAALCLKEILDRVELPAADEIPDVDAMESGSETKQLLQWRIPGTRITIARAEEGPRRHEHLFSPGTVQRAVEYYNDVKSIPYRQAGRATSPGFYDWYMTAPGHPIVAGVVDRLPAWTVLLAKQLHKSSERIEFDGAAAGR